MHSALLKLFPHFQTDPQASTFTVSSHFFGIWQKQSSTPLGQFVWLPKNKENKALSHGGKPYSQLAIQVTQSQTLRPSQPALARAYCQFIAMIKIQNKENKPSNVAFSHEVQTNSLLTLWLLPLLFSLALSDLYLQQATCLHVKQDTTRLVLYQLYHTSQEKSRKDRTTSFDARHF